MSYATVDQFKAWFEGRGHRLDSYMQEKDVDGDQETQITEALNAASGIMDMYFQDSRRDRASPRSCADTSRSG
jgi:hypothetical protein